MFFLGEKFKAKSDSVAIILILCGSFLIMGFSHQDSDDYTLAELKDMLKLPPALIFEVTTVAVMALAAVSLVLLLLKLNTLGRQLEREVELDLLSGLVPVKRSKSYKELIEYVESFDELETSKQESMAEWKTLRRFIKVPMVLIVVGFNMVSALCQASCKLFELSIYDHASWGLILTFLILMAITATTNVVLVNVTMALYKQVDFVQLNGASWF